MECRVYNYRVCGEAFFHCCLRAFSHLLLYNITQSRGIFFVQMKEYIVAIHTYIIIKWYVHD